MSRIQFLIVSALLFNIVIGVHIKGHKQFNSQKYLESLQAQQAALQAGVTDLDNTMSGVDQTLSQYDDISSKIKVLQNSIFEQQDKLFTLSTEMIPPLNLSTCNCQKLDGTQRAQLKTQAGLALEKVKNLNQKLDSMKDIDSEDLRFKQIKRDTKAQIFYLQKISEVLNSNCTSQAIVAPSVFQSNMYAPNWILGNQTINELVGAYIQRSKDYDHITNCPLEMPFYNGQNCIQCQQPTSVFNMETKKCENCEQGTLFNQQKRKCVTTKTVVPNIFTHQPWITEEGNFTNTMKTYSQISANSQKYLICPQENPFLINGQCSKCEALNQIYSIDIQKCVIPKEGTQYDSNVHNIIAKEDYQENFPNATNLVSVQKQTDNQDIDNCPQAKPFYDGIACIKCQQPFTLFDTSSKKCIACDAETVYNSQTRACQNRKILYNMTSADQILGSPEKTFQNYKSDLLEKIQASPEAILLQCQSENSYSVGDKCVTCSKGQYFLVAKNQCGKCQNVDTVAKLCLDGVAIVPNWDTINCRMIGEDIKLYKQQTVKLAEEDKENVYNCPVQKPFTDGKNCFDCSSNGYIFFDIHKKKCVKCPAKYQYDCAIHQCKLSFKPPFFLPNSEAKRYIGPNQTSVPEYLNNLQKKADAYPNVQTCSQQTPYTTSDGTKCVACAAPGVFNIQNGQCQVCPDQKIYNSQSFNCQSCAEDENYNSQTRTCDKKEYITNPKAGKKVGNSTQEVQKFIEDQNKAQENNALAEVCSQQTPFSNGKQCFSCPSQTPLFNTQTLNCSQCQDNTFYFSDKFICGVCQEGKVYNAQLETCVCQQGFELNKNMKCVPICEQGKTYDESLSQCVEQCPQGIQRNLDTLKCCGVGQSYNEASKSCEVAQIVCLQGESFSQTENKCIPNIRPTCAQGEEYNDQTKKCQQICEEGKTYNKLTQKCEIKCQQGKVYDSQKNQCVKVTFVSNLGANDNWVANDPFSLLQSFKKSAQQNPQQICAKDTPFWSGSACIACAESTYFDTHDKKCKTCPKGTQFNVFTHECRGQERYITNPNSNHLIYDGYSKGQINYFYNQNKTSNPKMQDCPIQTPFFNGKQCINCSQEKPFFTFTHRICASCPEESLFDEAKHQCMNQSGEAVSLDPTLASLAANVFSHRQTGRFKTNHKNIHNLKYH